MSSEDLPDVSALSVPGMPIDPDIEEIFELPADAPDRAPDPDAAVYPEDGLPEPVSEADAAPAAVSDGAEGREVEVEKPKSANMNRRAGVDQHFDINLALMKRVKKISIEIPFASQNARRLQKVILGVSAFKHIVAEAAGGKYGVPSRPDLEVQLICFPPAAAPPGAAEGAADTAPLPILFNNSRMAFVMSAKQEDELLLALSRHYPDPGTIKEAYIRAGDRKLNVLNSAKQRSWRKFINIYMSPMVQDDALIAEARERLLKFERLSDEAALVEEHQTYGGGEPEEEDTSDEENEASVNKKAKKKQHHGKHHGHKNTKK